MEIGIQIINVLSAEMFVQQIWKQIWNLIKQFTFCNKNTRGKTLFRAIHGEYYKVKFQRSMTRVNFRIFEHDRFFQKKISFNTRIRIRILYKDPDISSQINADPCGPRSFVSLSPNQLFPWYKTGFRIIKTRSWGRIEKFRCPRRPASWAGSRAGSPVS